MKIYAARAVTCREYFRRREIMTIKYIVAAALITPLLTVSSMAQQYVGGPKSSIAAATPQINSGGDIYAQGVDVYSQGVNVYSPGVRANKYRAHRGSPKAAVSRGN
jgi:hypothetical protein